MPGAKLDQDFPDPHPHASGRNNPGMAAEINSFTIMIGSMVFARRVELRLTQQQLAEMAGTNQAHISKIEAGDDSVTGKVLNKVMRVLNLASLQPGYQEQAAGRELVPQ
ncbi:helix-turn-helix transcriptional regulator [Paenibacillus sp. sptzw28]|uniref:helix-turn-helix domain-containing protein n=1 Tax=Paenibacillus sp. sptzw28 TaxID=715179 RepID=UPI001C6EC2C4|nr:helix-turn-helix domain-containing protein [Paenibacillus sp. sptzw28]QYR21012.1 helix-turn-helix transcriptional regulator [Paenibacillus sp. sptzw28]